MMHHTHILIRKTAEEIAGAFYELAAANPDFYTNWPKQRTYIRKNWPAFIPAARAQLTRMLQLDYSDHVKQEIYEALVNDRSINPAIRDATVH